MARIKVIPFFWISKQPSRQQEVISEKYHVSTNQATTIQIRPGKNSSSNYFRFKNDESYLGGKIFDQENI